MHVTNFLDFPSIRFGLAVTVLSLLPLLARSVRDRLKKKHGILTLSVAEVVIFMLSTAIAGSISRSGVDVGAATENLILHGRLNPEDTSNNFTSSTEAHALSWTGFVYGRDETALIEALGPMARANNSGMKLDQPEFLIGRDTANARTENNVLVVYWFHRCSADGCRADIVDWNDTHRRYEIIDSIDTILPRIPRLTSNGRPNLVGLDGTVFNWTGNHFKPDGRFVLSGTSNQDVEPAIRSTAPCDCSAYTCVSSIKQRFTVRGTLTTWSHGPVVLQPFKPVCVTRTAIAEMVEIRGLLPNVDYDEFAVQLQVPYSPDLRTCLGKACSVTGLIDLGITAHHVTHYLMFEPQVLIGGSEIASGP